MKNKDIINIGKFTFLTFLILGNICLFGYLIFKNDLFAACGLYLIAIGSVINLLIISGLLIYGLYYKPHRILCFRAIGLICINIPIAILYFYLGIYLMGF